MDKKLKRNMNQVSRNIKIWSKTLDNVRLGKSREREEVAIEMVSYWTKVYNRLEEKGIDEHTKRFENREWVKTQRNLYPKKGSRTLRVKGEFDSDLYYVGGTRFYRQ